MRHWNIVGLAVMAGLTLGLVGGCSDDGSQPRVAPTDSSSAASSVTPTPAPSPTGPVEPTLPPEAQGDDAAAAEAFVRHFWEMVNFAQATGRTQTLEDLAATNCAACSGGSERIRKAYDAGGRMEGGALALVAVESKAYQAGDRNGFLVTVEAEVEPQKITVPGAEPETYPGGPARIRLVVERAGPGWRVARMDPL